MVLNRIPKRTILRNKSQFLGIIILVAIASMTYALFAVSMRNIRENYDYYIKHYNQEDGHFITLQQVDRDYLKSKYGVEMEERLSYDWEEDGKTLRIFSPSKHINIPFVEKGRLPSKGEILIDPNFAGKQGYKVGDKILIGGRVFRISGFFYLPDYTYIIKNEQDFLNDPEHFGIAVMNLDDLKEFIPKPSYHYYMVKKLPADVDAFKRDINSRWNVLGFVLRDENPRIVYTDLKVSGVQKFILPLSLFIVIISSIILFIVIRRLINAMHAEIGTLYSLGYTKREILSVFMRFPVYIWLVGSVLGASVGFLEAIPLTNFFREYFTLPIVKTVYPVYEMGIAVILPAVFILTSGYLAINRFFKLSIVEMLHGIEKIKYNRLPRINFFDNFEFKNRIMLKTGLLHIGRELILALGVMFSTTLLLYGLSAKDAVMNTINKAYEENFRYKYAFILNSSSPHPEINLKALPAEAFNFQVFEVKGQKFSVMIYGVKKDSKFLNITDEKGQKLTFDGLVLTKSLAQKLNAKEGDSIELINKFNGKKYVLEIKKIANVYVGNYGYMGLDEFNNAFGFEKGSYMGLFSNRYLDIPESLLFDVQNKEYIMKSFKDSAKALEKSISTVVLIASVLALLIIYVLSSLAVAENKKPIGILKILGYRDKDVSYMLLGFNNLSFLVGFVLGVPFSKLVINSLMLSATKEIDFALSIDVKPTAILTGFVVLFATFLLTKYLAGRSIGKITPAEILKEQVD
ncbi:ABC transporter permease [Caldanaerobius polysaccharolyticus]|uniref:ABC transporter permease n=1 Tax=Caldanaerobius polysaccharolyticus TaxID=44256 RepID=UPI00047CFA7D|nr:FtsX-like permease family protein [Caldanaerobius polysaccharolyticus]